MWFAGRGVLNFSLHTADRAFPPPMIWGMHLKPLQGTSYCIITLFLFPATLLHHQEQKNIYTAAFYPHGHHEHTPHRCHDCTFAVSLLILATFFTSCLSFFFVCLLVLTPEPPQFIKEPEKHITAEMEKVVDIPCQARGELCVCLCVCRSMLTLCWPGSSWTFMFLLHLSHFLLPLELEWRCNI